MIVYNDILEKLAANGWSTYRIRTENVFSEGTLSRIRHGKPVTTDTINRICEMLKCQPGDILTWEPD